MRILLLKISLIALIIFVLPFQAYSAEVFQVRSSSLLQIGDQNRIYKVQIACLEVSSQKEDDATNWLREELPRHSKVNLKPVGYIDGVLLAKVIKLDSHIDIAKSMENEGFSKNKCS